MDEKVEILARAEEDKHMDSLAHATEYKYIIKVMKMR